MKTKPYNQENDQQSKVSEPMEAYMKTDTSLSLIDSYWSLLKDLSADIKLKLIARLSSSIVEDKAKEECNDLADKFYGAWKEDKSAEELINEIRNSRVVGTRQLESFE